MKVVETSHFVPFLDPDDMVMCCPASQTAADVNRMAEEIGLRFPLICRDDASLEEHTKVVEYSPHSARFGPFADNILGFNWKLKSGTIVRVGERVIKSTTGFDLNRFLLHSDGRYGRAQDYVLRLRPRDYDTAECVFVGNSAALDRAQQMIVHSAWVHWLDTVNRDFCADGSDVLHVTAGCAQGERNVFEKFFQEVAVATKVQCTSDGTLAVRGFPALSVKATDNATASIAQELLVRWGGAVRILAVNAVVHYFPVAAEPPPVHHLRSLADRCEEEGGHLFGPWWPAPFSVSAQELAWAETLEKTWSQI